MEWISVKDRLPEEMPEYRERKAIYCLVAIESRYPHGKPLVVKRQRRKNPILHYPYYEWVWSHNAGDDVTHWMPLPEPPEV